MPASPFALLQTFEGINVPELVSVLILLLFSLALHEVAHGWVALRCGDPTARDLGRLSLDPLRHIDPIMTILLPIVLYVTTGWIFGGAKPVPVDYHRLRRPLRDMSLVAIAGPATNFLLAILFWALFRVAVQGFEVDPNMLVGRVLYQGVQFNLLLAAFNLIPIPPLDGSRVMAWILPTEMRLPYLRLERFGLLIVFGLLYLGLLRTVLLPVMGGMFVVVRFLVSGGGLW